MKVFILIFYVLIGGMAFCQCSPWTWNNLVPNNSWEQLNYNAWFNNCANDHLEFGQCDPSLCTNIGVNETDANIISDYWGTITKWGVPNEKLFIANPWIGSPDLYSTELTPPNIGTPRSGTKFLSCAREAVVVKLDEPLVPGCDYYIEIFSKRDDAGYCSISAYDRYPKHWNAQGRDIEESNSVHHEKIIEWDTNDPAFNDWHKVSTFFSVAEQRDWITVAGKGAFEDIKIYKVPDLCADHWYFDNTEFNKPVEVFQAGDFIKVGTGVDPEQGQLDGIVTFKSGNHTVLRAANYVELIPGAYIEEPGATAEVVIQPCTSLCPPIEFPTTRYECVSTPTNIGVPNYVGTFAQLQWSPSTYLDDPNSENPVFTPPAGTGSITYTVNYIQNCDYQGFQASGIFNVTVLYAAGSGSLSPSVSFSGVNYDDYNFSASIDVNPDVYELEISWTPTAFPSLPYVTLVRDSDFQNGQYLLELSQLMTSCCQDVTINVLARDYCGNEISTSYLWDKSNGAPQMLNVPQILYTPDDNDGIDDEYCFSSVNACRFEFEIYSGAGAAFRYDESGVITGDTTCLDWYGQRNNGTLFDDGDYSVILRLFNDCGQEFDDHEAFKICRDGVCWGKSSGGTGDSGIPQYSNSDSRDMNDSPAYSVKTINQDIYIAPLLYEVSTAQYRLYDLSGKVVRNGYVSESPILGVSRGVYVIEFANGDQHIERHKLSIMGK